MHRVRLGAFHLYLSSVIVPLIGMEKESESKVVIVGPYLAWKSYNRNW